MKNHSKALLFLILTAIFWSFGGLLIKSINWNPMAIAGMRSTIAIPFLLLVIRKNHFSFSFYQIAGAFFYSVTVISFVCATKLTTAANAIIIQYTAPIYVAILGIWLLQEKVKPSDWIVILVAMSGICLFFIDRVSAGNMLGNIVALVSGISFALMIVFMRKQKDSYPLSSIFIGNIITVIVMIPFMFDAVPKDRNSWVALILLGALQQGLASIFYSIAIKHATALEAIMVPLIEPILNPIWVLLFIGEKPTKWAFIGGIIVICSLIIHSKIAMNQRSNNKCIDFTEGKKIYE